MPTSEMTPDQQKARIGAIVEAVVDLVVKQSGGDGFVMSVAVANVAAWLAEHAMKAGGKAALEDWCLQVFSTTLRAIEQSTGVRLSVTTDVLALTRAVQVEREDTIKAVSEIASIGRGVKDTVIRAIQMRSA
jgi:hypothetical protein